MICHSILFQKCTHHSAADSRQQIFTNQYLMVMKYLQYKKFVAKPRKILIAELYGLHCHRQCNMNV